MKSIIKNILESNKIIDFILFNFSTILLIYVFVHHLEETVLAYVSYLMSAYALAIFIIWFCKVCKFISAFIKENRVYKIYKKNDKLNIKMLLVFSLLVNLIYGIFKLYSGIYYKSAWFITFAMYYLLLCFMKFLLVHSVKNNEFGKYLLKEYRKLKHTGVILLFLDLILSGMIILIVHQNPRIVYPGYLIYVVAIYDFYLIISAFVNVIKPKKEKSPVLIASKCINLTVAMISMISLEVAMIYQFGENDGNFKFMMISCTGFFVSY